jgi:hypothetical protein
MTTTTVVVSRINLIIVEISSLQTPPQDFALSTIYAKPEHHRGVAITAYQMPKKKSQGYGQNRMAKKYYAYEELVDLSVDQEGFFKPYGTLGNHRFRPTQLPNGDVLVEGFGSDGALTGTVIVSPRHNLGYDKGCVWRALKPEFIRDPLSRVLAQHKLGKDRVKWVHPGTRIYLREIFYSAGPEYHTFADGECVGHTTHFGLATVRRIFRHPIDQLNRVGDFYVAIGTPREVVAEWVDEVMGTGAFGSTKADHPFRVEAERDSVDL